MKGTDDFLSTVLDTEAELASRPDGVIARLLDDDAAHKSGGSRRLTAWAVSAVVALAAAMVPLPHLLSDSGSAQLSNHQSLSTTATSSRAVLPPGHIDLHENGVHVALDERGSSALDRWRSWQLPCLLSALDHGAQAHVACAGLRGDYPRWEVLVRSGPAAVPDRPLWFRWKSPVSRVFVALGNIAQFDLPASRRTARVTSVSGQVRYRGERGHSRWAHRILTSIYFRDQNVQVSILTPNHAAIAWLTGSIYVD